MAGKGVNKVILIGNLGQDPELKYTGSGTAFCNLSVATSDSYKDANGNLVDNTQWHKVVVWARLAEICNEYLKKGSKVYLEGSLQTRNYDDKDGNKKYITEVKAREMVMLDSRGGGGGGGYSPNAGGGNASSGVKVSTGAPAPTSADDDLPF